MSATAAWLHATPCPVHESTSRRPALVETPSPAESSSPGVPPIRARVVMALVSLLLVLAGFGWLLAELGRHPISSVRIAAEFRHLDRSELEKLVQPHLGGSFFAVDVNAVRLAARSMPWVREASVRRVWPGSIHIAIVEREAAYRWQSTGLLESDGTLFTPTARDGFDKLPLLAGPDETHAEVVTLFKQTAALLAAIQQPLRMLEMSARGAWRARLANGIELVLGREPRQAAMRRLARAFPAVLAGQQERIEAIDLRYANGFAVRWKPVLPQAGATPETQG